MGKIDKLLRVLAFACVLLDPTSVRAEESAEGHNTQGNELYKAGKLEEAALQYSYALEIDPKNPKYYSNRALVYLGLKRFDKALRDA